MNEIDEARERNTEKEREAAYDKLMMAERLLRDARACGINRVLGWFERTFGPFREIGEYSPAVQKLIQSAEKHRDECATKLEKLIPVHRFGEGLRRDVMPTSKLLTGDAEADAKRLLQ